MRMSMAGLGRPPDIWHWTLRHFRAIQREYVRIVAPRAATDDDGNVTEIAPGITVERYDTRES